MRIVREAFGSVKVTEIDEAAVTAFIRKLPHAARSKVNIEDQAQPVSQLLPQRREMDHRQPDRERQGQGQERRRQDPGRPGDQATPERVPGLRAPGRRHPLHHCPALLSGCVPSRPYASGGNGSISGDPADRGLRLETSKTRETRFVELEPLAEEWLLPFRLPDGPITGPFFPETLRAVKVAASFIFGEDDGNRWIKDVLRHCY